MSSFLSNITKRHFGQVPLVAARKRALFESRNFAEAPALPIAEEVISIAKNEEIDRNHAPLKTATDETISNASVTIDNPIAKLPLGESAAQNNKDTPVVFTKQPTKEGALLKASPSNIAEPVANDSYDDSNVTTQEKGSTVQGSKGNSLLIINNTLPKASSNIDQQTKIIQHHFDSPQVDTNDSLTMSPASLPNVKIHIGRIEVKAAPQKNAPTRKTRKTGGNPKLSLEQYLKNRT